MNIIRLVISREFISRVTKRSFILMTLLGPLIFVIILIVPLWLSISTSDTPGLVLFSNNYDERIEIPSIERYIVQQVSSDMAVALQELNARKADALLYLSTDGHPTLYLSEPAAEDLTPLLEAQISAQLTEKRLLELGITQAQVADLLQRGKLRLERLYTLDKTSFNVASGISLLGAIIIYMFILAYGMQVMRGVIEEKTSRISEVVLTSISPLQLMFGKILGIAMVSIFQFTIWIIFGMVASMFLSARYGASMQLFRDENIQRTMQTEGIDMRQAMEWNQLINAFESINIFGLIATFLFFFIFGYLFYASIFAAVGSSVDSETDTQQFLFPLTLPILICFSMFQFVLENPDSNVTFWLSVIPLTSPVIIMLRFVQGIPAHVLAISMVVLVASFILVTRLAAKVYRTGMLMYGKKASLKEIITWMRRS